MVPALCGYPLQTHGYSEPRRRSRFPGFHRETTGVYAPNGHPGAEPLPALGRCWGSCPYVSPATQAFACSSSPTGNTRASPGIIHANSLVARAIQGVS
jgi:hypothetical protein